MSPTETLLNRGRIVADGTSLAGGGAAFVDLLVPGENDLTVSADMNGAIAGDLKVQVQPFEADNLTLMPIDLPTATVVGPAFGSGKNLYQGHWNVAGQDKVRVILTNSNAGAQTVNRASWRLG